MALTKKQQQIRQRWTKALRSGKFKQGKNYLHTKGILRDRYCCLGVLCVLAVRAKVIPKPKLDDGLFEYGDGSTRTLPMEVQKWAGMRTYSGSFGSGSLVLLNDGTDGDKAKSFASIAKIIDSEPEGLFI